METEKDRIPFIERFKRDKEAQATFNKMEYQRRLNRLLREIEELKVKYGQN